MTNQLVENAEKRLLGAPRIGLTPREVARNLRLGPNRDQHWPGSAVRWNPTAAQLREVSETAEVPGQ